MLGSAVDVGDRVNRFGHRVIRRGGSAEKSNARASSSRVAFRHPAELFHLSAAGVLQVDVQAGRFGIACREALLAKWLTPDGTPR
jgi:hypothetical protein